MKVVLIHGAPASGKLTVAKVLSSQHGFKLFHNHLVVDLSLSIYDEFGEKDFHEFTDSIRRKTLSKANEIGVTYLVMTWVVCSKMHQQVVQTYLNFFEQEGIDIFPVHLAPSKAELLQRVVADERKPTHKISCEKLLAEYLAQCEYAPIETSKTIIIDNSNLSPEFVANSILTHVH